MIMGLWSIVCISSSLLLMAVTFNRKLPLVMARTIWAPGILWICGVKLSIQGTSNINNAAPLIFVSNHQSYMDIPCLFKAIPQNLYFTAKQQLKKLPFVGWYMSLTGMIFIDRSNKQKAASSINKAGELIKRGRNILIFPEGRRSMNGAIGSFQKGAFHLALKSNASIIPVAISGTANVWYKKRFRLIPGKVSVSIGNPIPSNGYSGSSLQQFKDRIRREIIDLQAAYPS